MNIKISLQLMAQQRQRMLEAAAQGKPFQEKMITMVKTPKALWGGTVPFGTVFVPTTLVQGIATDYIIKWLSRGKKEPSQGDKLLGAMGAGTLSAFGLTPSSAIVVKQRKEGCGPMLAARSLYFEHGLLRGFYRALPEMIVRENFSTVGFFVMAPIFKEAIKEKTGNETVSSLAGGAAAGFTAALGSHLADTRLTLIQADPGKKHPMSRNFVMKTGWSGFSARGPMVALAVAVYQVSSDAFSAFMKKFS